MSKFCWNLSFLSFLVFQEFRAAKARVNRRAMRQAYREPTEDTPMEQKAALTAYGTEAGPKELFLGLGIRHFWPFFECDGIARP